MPVPKPETCRIEPSSSKVIRPISLAHVVFRTANLQRMIDFWALFLGATVVFQNNAVAFLQYDDEHHRIAFIADPSAQPQLSGGKGAGMHHVAFTFASLADLVQAPEEATEFMQGALFAENPLGTDFDPEELDRKIRSGVEDSVLKKRVEIGPRVMAL
ncbi:hypothetical protein O988_04391 [Pseudogymnoascus sp. VKM F-3808]|nr:hypothetical protein O988_04391 [Pseudogymnoascus sp. VKM F-3808]